jgi:methionyl-tRNA formyltransferase
MNIVYFTKGTRGSECLSAILDAGYSVNCVVGVTREERIDELCNQSNIPLIFPEKINSPETLKILMSYDPDLFILSGYNKIIKLPVIQLPKLGTINLHGGKLPEYRGAAPINWQIINGETSGGCAIIYVDEGIDTGDIIAQEMYSIKPDDTHASILEKTLRIFPALLLSVLKKIEQGSVQAQKQDPLAGGYFCRRYPRDSQINWREMDDIQVHNLVRGMHGPYPAAFTFSRDIKVEINKSQVLQETISGLPGRVPLKRGKDVVVIAKNRGILIQEISVNGKKENPGDFFNIGEDLK